MRLTRMHPPCMQRFRDLCAASCLLQAAVELSSERKWLCTGTPINNAVDDLLGQMASVHIMPLGKKTYFDSYIKVSRRVRAGPGPVMRTHAALPASGCDAIRLCACAHTHSQTCMPVSCWCVLLRSMPLAPASGGATPHRCCSCCPRQ